MCATLWQGEFNIRWQFLILILIYYIHCSAVLIRLYNTILLVCGTVRPCSLEQWLQVSSVNTAQTTGKFPVFHNSGISGFLEM